MTAKCYVRQKRLTFFSGVIAISSGAMPLSVFIRHYYEKTSVAVDRDKNLMNIENKIQSNKKTEFLKML